MEPLREDRPARYYPSYAGRAFLTYVPLIPWIKIPFERLDESWLKSTRTPEPWAEHGEHFTHKMSMAIVEDLARSNLFRSVRLADPSGEPVEADLTLRGTLRSTQFDAYVSSYMLGAPGVLLWLLPIPVGRNAATVELELELRDRDDRIVWSARVKGRAGQLFWLYSSQANIGGEFSLEICRYKRNDHGVDRDSLWAYHSEALRRAMVDAKQSLFSQLSSRQEGSSSGR